MKIITQEKQNEYLKKKHNKNNNFYSVAKTFENVVSLRQFVKEIKP